MAKKPKQYDDDDGRVITSMDVAGMPWHDRRERKAKKDIVTTIGEKDQPVKPKTVLTRSEARRYTWYALLAGLTIVLVYAVVWILFTLFLTKVWLR